jgi:hypothetical protein
LGKCLGDRRRDELPMEKKSTTNSTKPKAKRHRSPLRRQPWRWVFSPRKKWESSPETATIGLKWLGRMGQRQSERRDSNPCPISCGRSPQCLPIQGRPRVRTGVSILQPSYPSDSSSIHLSRAPVHVSADGRLAADPPVLSRPCTGELDVSHCVGRPMPSVALVRLIVHLTHTHI